MRLSLILLTFLLLWNSAFASPWDPEADPMCQARNAYSSLPKELTIIGSLVDKYLFPGGFKEPTKEEILFIKNNPSAAFVITNSACSSLVLSYAICGVSIKNAEFHRAWDEEADAIRHFSFSAFLACSRGKKFAESYTISHESNPNKWGPASKMDIKNNYKGFEWADPHFGRCNLPDLERRVLLAALTGLSPGGGLTTVRKGDTLCKNPKEVYDRIYKMSPDEFRDFTHQDFQDFKKRFPQYCK